VSEWGKCEILLGPKGTLSLCGDPINLLEQGEITMLSGNFSSYTLPRKAEGVPVEHIKKPLAEHVKIESFFTPDTQSVHLKVGVSPMAKIGKPGHVELVKIRDKPVEEDEINEIIAEIMDNVRAKENCFVEISKFGAIVVQMGDYRISITKPPFSDAMELTAVTPIVSLALDDYSLHSRN